MGDDLRSAIEPLANADVQTLAARMSPRDRRKTRGFVRARCKGEARRSPGALADAECAGAVENIENGGNVGAHETGAALGGGKIIAKADLQFLDGIAEVRKVVIGKSRQSLHQDQTAKAGGVSRAHGRKTSHSRSFLGSVDTLTLRVENYQDAPFVRNRQTADDWGEPRLVSTAAVDDEPAAGKKTDADARTRSPPKLQRITFHVERQIVEAAQPGSDGKRKLSAGTQTGVSRNNVRNFHSMSVAKPQQSLHFLQMLQGPVGLGAGNFADVCSFDRKACS